MAEGEPTKNTTASVIPRFKSLCDFAVVKTGVVPPFFSYSMRRTQRLFVSVVPFAYHPFSFRGVSAGFNRKIHRKERKEIRRTIALPFVFIYELTAVRSRQKSHHREPRLSPKEREREFIRSCPASLASYI